VEIIQPIFARITKVDEVTRTVTGRATQEMVDRDREVFDYVTSKPNFQQWSASVFSDTGGKSLGNVRAMHGSVAAGILKDIQFLDHEKAIDVTAHITDDQEWKKVTSGTYSGFSIGGKYTKKWPDVVNGKMVQRYTADPAEISIVDRPCVPAAKFFTVHKADGSDIEVPFAPSLMLPMEGTATDGGKTAGLDLLVKHGIKRVELKKEVLPRGEQGRFNNAGHAGSERSAAALAAAGRAFAFARKTTSGSVNAATEAQQATQKAIESGTPEAHKTAWIKHTAAATLHGTPDENDTHAKSAIEAHTEAASFHRQYMKIAGGSGIGGGSSPDDVSKAAAPDKGAGAMTATGAAIASSHQAISTNDVEEHFNAAAAHAAAAKEQLELDNKELAAHHINAAQAHMQWNSGKTVKMQVPATHGHVLH